MYLPTIFFLKKKVLALLAITGLVAGSNGETLVAPVAAH